MKKYIKFLIIILFCFSLIGCNSQKQSRPNEEIIRFTTGKLKDIKVIKNKKDIRAIKEIVNNSKWSDKIYTRNQDFYSLWIEREEEKTRISTYDVWDDNGGDTIIFNEKTGRYAILNVDDLIKLKSQFKWN